MAKKVFYFLLGLSLSLILFSCEKEERIEACDSTCGRVVDLEIIDNNQGKLTYRAKTENVCDRTIRWKNETRYTGTGKPDWWGDDVICF